MGAFDHSTELQQMLDLLRAGDPSVRDRLIERSFDRLRRLARRMLRHHEDLRAVLETDDVLQSAAVRLHRSLPEVQPPTVRRFFALAAVQIRRELIDLVRRHLGQGGEKASRVVYLGGPPSTGHHPLLEAKQDPTTEPTNMAEWADFHEKAAALPDDEREVFDLIWYHGYSQAEAAELLQVSTRTVKRRWRSAQVLLYQALHGEGPFTS